MRQQFFKKDLQKTNSLATNLVRILKKLVKLDITIKGLKEIGP